MDIDYKILFNQKLHLVQRVFGNEEVGVEAME
jgi:hypothetical protein